MPSSKPCRALCLALAAAAAAAGAHAHDIDRDAWLLPPEPEFSRSPRDQRPFWHPLDFARVGQTGNDRPPEFARDLEARLIAAAARLDREEVERLLAEGANPNRPGDESGTRALVHAVAAGDVEMTRVLLDAGADPNLRGHGLTPLGLAALKGQARIARLLLAAGADPDLKGADGNTPLYNAALLGHAEVIRELTPYRPDYTRLNAGLPGYEGLTALGIAAMQGNTAAMAALLAGGAQTETLDKSNRTALSYAVMRQRRGAVLLLLDHGAQTGVMAVDAY